MLAVELPIGPEGTDRMPIRWRPPIALVVALVAAPLVALVVGCGSSEPTADPTAPTLPGTSAPATTEAPTGPVLASNWNGVRTAGPGLVIAFYGLAPTTTPDDPCQSDYQAVVEESGDEVRVTVHGSHVDTCAEDIAYGRSLTVPLAEPLGARRLVNGATEQAETAFDGGRLPDATWLPDGWQQQSDLPADPHTGPVTAWQIGWGPSSSPGSPCGGDVTSITLTVGSPDLLTQTWVTSFTVVGTATVHGQPAEQARYQTGPPEHPTNETMLRWSEGTDAFVLRSAPSCVGDPPADFPVLQQLADGLS